jgi:hypothetical protein
MFGDYLRFIETGRAWWAGTYIGPYPVPTIGLFAALSLIPWQVGYIALSGLGIFALLVRLKRSTPLWFAFIPILQNLLIGNLDLVWWGLWTTRKPVAYALMTLKPHLFPFAIPEIIRWPRRDKLAWLAWTAALWIPSWLVRPNWIGEWLSSLAHISRVAGHWASDLWSAPLPVIVISLMLLLLFWIVKKRPPFLRAATLFLNPAIGSYDYALLSGSSHWIIIPASWVAQIMERYYHAYWGWAVLGLLSSLATRPTASAQDHTTKSEIKAGVKVAK